MKIRPVILCGGSGTRLWPVSRADYPKQFVDFPKKTGNENSLFRYALDRLENLSSDFTVAAPTIVASKDYRFYVNQQIGHWGNQAKIFLEPSARNTATSVSIAALMEDEDSILAVFPSDQAIDNRALSKAVEIAVPMCECGEIVLLGIKPTYAETGYGYIKTVGEPTGNQAVDVDRFVEKPNKETALTYIKEGCYFWNSGIFIMKASVWLKALGLCRPDIKEAVCKVWKDKDQLSPYEWTADKAEFDEIPAESVDYAVLEKCVDLGIPLKVVPFSGKWTDLGSWKSVYDSVPKSADGNFQLGQSVLNQSQNCMVVSTSRPVVVNGLNNVAVIDTSDALLVTDLASCQDVKAVVKNLKDEGYKQAYEHRIGRRPWGYYDSIDEGNGFKVKRIVVRPGSSLSLQRHQHRAEHWIVTKGVAEVRIGDETKVVNENESVFIEQKQIHRLTNRGSEDLILIEVQIGSYLGEDDIERLEDIYGRV